MRTMLLASMLVVSVLAISQSIAEKTHVPDCSGRWPTIMTLVHMKNAGLLNGGQIDSSKTETMRLASEGIGKNLWHQVYYVTFVKKSGEAVHAVAVHDASLDECSISGVEGFVVSAT